MISINVGIINNNNNNNTAPLTKQQAKTDQLQTGLAELFALMLGIQTTETDIISTISEKIESKQDTKQPEMVTSEVDDNDEENSLLIAYSLPLLHKTPELLVSKQSVVQEETIIKTEQADKSEPNLQTLQIQADKSKITEIQHMPQVESIFASDIKEDFKITVEMPEIESKATPQHDVKSFSFNIISETETNKQQIKIETIKTNEQLTKPVEIKAVELQHVEIQQVAEIKKQIPKSETEKQAQFSTIKAQHFNFENEIDVVAKNQEAPVLPKETIVLLATEIKRASTQGLTEITLQLKPEGLGKVVINLKKTSEKLEVVLKTELSDTNTLIKLKLDELRNELNLSQIDKHLTTTVVLEAQEPNLFNTNTNTNTSTTHSNAFENQNNSFTGNKEERISYETDKSIKSSEKNNTKNILNFRKGKFDLRI